MQGATGDYLVKEAQEREYGAKAIPDFVDTARGDGGMRVGTLEVYPHHL